MSSFAGSDEERRKGILSHMNGSHSRELSHYLRHYCGLSRRQASQPVLSDITLQGMRIKANGADYVVHFKPILQSWSDVRPRVVEMDKVAREHLGLSDIYINTFALPSFLEVLLLCAVLSYFVSLGSLPWVVPGTALTGFLTAYFPGGPDTFRWLVRALFLPVMAIHIGEAAYLDRTRLRKHGVERWSGVWWLWTINNFFEGFPVFNRFDDLVAKKRTIKEAKKH